MKRICSSCLRPRQPSNANGIDVGYRISDSEECDVEVILEGLTEIKSNGFSGLDYSLYISSRQKPDIVNSIKDEYPKDRSNKSVEVEKSRKERDLGSFEKDSDRLDIYPNVEEVINIYNKEDLVDVYRKVDDIYKFQRVGEFDIYPKLDESLESSNLEFTNISYRSERKRQTPKLQEVISLYSKSSFENISENEYIDFNREETLSICSYNSKEEEMVGNVEDLNNYFIEARKSYDQLLRNPCLYDPKNKKFIPEEDFKDEDVEIVEKDLSVIGDKSPKDRHDIISKLRDSTENVSQNESDKLEYIKRLNYVYVDRKVVGRKIEKKLDKSLILSKDTKDKSKKDDLSSSSTSSASDGPEDIDKDKFDGPDDDLNDASGGFGKNYGRRGSKDDKSNEQGKGKSYESKSEDGGSKFEMESKEESKEVDECKNEVKDKKKKSKDQKLSKKIRVKRTIKTIGSYKESEAPPEFQMDENIMNSFNGNYTMYNDKNFINDYNSKFFLQNYCIQYNPVTLVNNVMNIEGLSKMDLRRMYSNGKRRSLRLKNGLNGMMSANYMENAKFKMNHLPNSNDLNSKDPNSEGDLNCLNHNDVKSSKRMKGVKRKVDEIYAVNNNEMYDLLMKQMERLKRYQLDNFPPGHTDSQYYPVDKEKLMLFLKNNYLKSLEDMNKNDKLCDGDCCDGDELNEESEGLNDLKEIKDDKEEELKLSIEDLDIKDILVFNKFISNLNNSKLLNGVESSTNALREDLALKEGVLLDSKEVLKDSLNGTLADNMNALAENGDNINKDHLQNNFNEKALSDKDNHDLIEFIKELDETTNTTSSVESNYLTNSYLLSSTSTNKKSSLWSPKVGDDFKGEDSKGEDDGKDVLMGDFNNFYYINSFKKNKNYERVGERGSRREDDEFKLEDLNDDINKLRYLNELTGGVTNLGDIHKLGINNINNIQSLLENSSSNSFGDSVDTNARKDVGVRKEIKKVNSSNLYKRKYNDNNIKVKKIYKYNNNNTLKFLNPSNSTLNTSNSTTSNTTTNPMHTSNSTSNTPTLPTNALTISCNIGNNTNNMNRLDIDEKIDEDDELMNISTPKNKKTNVNLKCIELIKSNSDKLARTINNTIYNKKYNTTTTNVTNAKNPKALKNKRNILINPMSNSIGGNTKGGLNALNAKNATKDRSDMNMEDDKREDSWISEMWNDNINIITYKKIKLGFGSFSTVSLAILRVINTFTPSPKDLHVGTSKDTPNKDNKDKEKEKLIYECAIKNINNNYGELSHYQYIKEKEMMLHYNQNVLKPITCRIMYSHNSPNVPTSSNIVGNNKTYQLLLPRAKGDLLTMLNKLIIYRTLLIHNTICTPKSTPRGVSNGISKDLGTKEVPKDKDNKVRLYGLFNIEIKYLLIQILNALSFIHMCFQGNILRHTDIKLTNILVFCEDKDCYNPFKWHLKLADFGCSLLIYPNQYFKQVYNIFNIPYNGSNASQAPSATAAKDGSVTSTKDVSKDKSNNVIIKKWYNHLYYQMLSYNIGTLRYNSPESLLYDEYLNKRSNNNQQLLNILYGDIYDYPLIRVGGVKDNLGESRGKDDSDNSQIILDGSKYIRIDMKSDIWSLGIILSELIKYSIYDVSFINSNYYPISPSSFKGAFNEDLTNGCDNGVKGDCEIPNVFDYYIKYLTSNSGALSKDACVKATPSKSVSNVDSTKSGTKAMPRDTPRDNINIKSVVKNKLYNNLGNGIFYNKIYHHLYKTSSSNVLRNVNSKSSRKGPDNIKNKYIWDYIDPLDYYNYSYNANVNNEGVVVGGVKDNVEGRLKDNKMEKDKENKLLSFYINNICNNKFGVRSQKLLELYKKNELISIDSNLLNLLTNLLSYDPNERMSSFEILGHEYFNDISPLIFNIIDHNNQIYINKYNYLYSLFSSTPNTNHNDVPIGITKDTPNKDNKEKLLNDFYNYSWYKGPLYYYITNSPNCSKDTALKDEDKLYIYKLEYNIFNNKEYEIYGNNDTIFKLLLNIKNKFNFTYQQLNTTYASYLLSKELYKLKYTKP